MQRCLSGQAFVGKLVHEGPRVYEPDREIRADVDYLGGARVVAIGRINGVGVLRGRVEHQEHCHEKRAGRGWGYAAGVGRDKKALSWEEETGHREQGEGGAGGRSKDLQGEEIGHK